MKIYVYGSVKSRKISKGDSRSCKEANGRGAKSGSNGLDAYGQREVTLEDASRCFEDTICCRVASAHVA
ncbi:hypothetical protein JG688_00010463 [Phytophthora aleatoria]|uniref:Uncharacterized protein n=1 Tax=Phytophthora aleatoria TaxID=2496075 RepID=A0A8J5M1N6_9STRA|nr:hypothetical protein JG688_00010463 [Phytophthora aleatoria]